MLTAMLPPINLFSTRQMDKRAVMVIGATGFAGSSLVTQLSNSGHRVFALSRNAYRLPTLANVEVFPQPMDNSSLLHQLLPHCKVVIHMASDSTPGSTSSQPALEVSANLLPTLRLLEVMQNYPQTLLAYASSGGATYKSTDTQCAETAPLAPLSYYGAGKAAIEQFLQTYAQQFCGKVIILRPSNLYGPGQAFKKGFGIIPTAFHHLQHGSTMEIWGDGKIVRDYLYIDDFTRLCQAVIDRDIAPGSFTVYNAGSSVGSTINTICDLAEQVSRMKLARHYLHGRTVDSPSIVLDCAKARRELGWSASISLETGMQYTWDHYKQNAV